MIALEKNKEFLQFETGNEMADIERISHYEQILDRVNLVLQQLENALEAFEDIQNDISALEQYYTSGEWKADYDAGAGGFLPAGLKRGVLSQDGIDHTLDRYRDTKEKITN